MKYSLWILIIVLFASSCKPYKATVSRETDNKYNELRTVTPTWEYQKPGGQWVLPLIATGGAAYYGYLNDITIDEETYVEWESAGIHALGGLLAGALVNAIIFPKPKFGQRKQFERSDTDKWLASYNKSLNRQYELKEATRNTLVLVPTDVLVNLRKNYRTLLQDLQKDNPKTTYEELQDWKRELNGRYTVLPPQEINQVRNAIENNEKRIASAQILRQAEALKDLPDTYESLGYVTSFKKDFHAIAFVLDQSLISNTESIIDEKINRILRNSIPDELTRIEQLPYEVHEINSYYREYNSQYFEVARYDLAKQGYQKLKDKKTQAVYSIASQLIKQINNTESLKNLSILENTYLTTTNPSPKISDIQQLIDLKRSEILERQEPTTWWGIIESNLFFKTTFCLVKAYLTFNSFVFISALEAFGGKKNFTAEEFANGFIKYLQDNHISNQAINDFINAIGGIQCLYNAMLELNSRSGY
ncbi:hypothetical protein AB9P05_17270 [Roseivirga sp. BDSF3-8]|uniref:hypothetical protein n=1 Tax=Roseivirga sp. BDSF3-8 TaxID=3241598 RepID=UPI003531C18A